MECGDWALSMGNSLAVLAAGAGGSLAANWGLSRLAARLGLCDRPDSGKCEVRSAKCEVWDPEFDTRHSEFALSTLKPHSRPMPLSGGAGLLLGVLLAGALAASIPNPKPEIQNPGVVIALSAVAFLGFGLGLWDDLRWKNATVPGAKLLLQAAAASGMALALACAGVRPAPGGFGLVLAAGYCVCSMNAWNLEDGMDGLTGSEAAISALGFAGCFALSGNTIPALFALGLVAALAGFLALNLHPALVFMGDSGSHLLGALLAGLAVVLVSSAGFAALPATVLIIGLPVADTGWVIIRRLANRNRLGAGDREHFYDILHRRGLSIRQTVLLCSLIQAALVAAGVLWMEGVIR